MDGFPYCQGIFRSHYWFILLVREWQWHLFGVDDKDDNVTQDFKWRTTEMGMLRLDLTIEHLWKLCHKACTHTSVCSMFQMKIFSSTSENRICVWSLLSQLVFARIHPSLLKSPESSQCLHQKGNQVLSLLLKGWIHLEHESSLERWYCWAFHPVRVRQADVSQPLTVSMGGPAAKSTNP